MWEADTIRFICENLAKGGDVIHAGTYFGDFLPALSASCVPGAKVWAFEPNPESFLCARATASLNACENVNLFHAALTDADGTIRVVTMGPTGRSLGGLSHVSTDEGSMEVPARMIDNTFPLDRRVSVLQLDLEGHEASAITGAIGTIERCRPVVIVESLPPPALKTLFDLGYRVLSKVDGNTTLVYG